jgi:hypothetical protein
MDITTIFDGRFKSWTHVWANIVLLRAENIDIPLSAFKQIVLFMIELEKNGEDVIEPNVGLIKKGDD